MKKMLVLALLSSSMMFAEPTAVAPQAASLISRFLTQLARPFNATGRGISAAASTVVSASKAASSAVAGSVSSAATSTKNAVVSAAGSVATTVTTNAGKAVTFVDGHKKSTVSVVAVAGIAALYYTNAAFRAKVRELLGLDKTEVKNA